MKLSELIAKYGDDIVRFQTLDASVISLDWDHKKGTRVTFGTEVTIHPKTGLDKLGIVVWMDRDRAQKIIDGAKGK